ncbi:MAG TPA: hypothetical protein VN253_12825, partial [Kofleriaceae bacterium]|nr:hypothetical protein [Kofleriaceae bacterium]
EPTTEGKGKGPGGEPTTEGKGKGPGGEPTTEGKGPGGEPTGKGPGGEPTTEGKGKGPGEGEGQGKTGPEGKGQGKTEPEGKGHGKTEPEGESHGKTEPEGQGKTEPEGEGHGKTESEGEGQGKGDQEGEGQGKTEPEGKGKGDPEGEGQGKTEPEGKGKGEPEGEGQGKTGPEGEGQSKTEPDAEGQSKTEPESEGQGKTEPENKTTGEKEPSRPEQGLRDKASTEKFAESMRSLEKDWPNLTPEERLNRIADALKGGLKESGIPEMEVGSGDLGGRNGEFDFTTWKVKIDKGLLSHNQISSEKLADVANTAYHEARHGEQWYMIARHMHGMGMSPAEISARMGIPEHIAQTAAADTHPMTPKQATDAKAYYDSVYGANAGARNQTLHDLDTTAKAVEQARKDYQAIEHDPTVPASEKAAKLKEWQDAWAASDAAYQKYRALPEEADAWAVGDAAGDAYKNPPPKPPEKVGGSTEPGPGTGKPTSGKTEPTSGKTEDPLQPRSENPQEKPPGVEEPAPKKHVVKPEDVDTVVQTLKETGRLTGDLSQFEKVIHDAKLGTEGALGEIEAVKRWIEEGHTVEVLTEVQNQKGPDGSPIKNPDYRVDGKITEIKSRSEALDDRWVKDQIAKANKQVKKSGTDEQGTAELQLRGEEAGRATLDEVEAQVKGAFTESRGSRLDGVVVWKDGVKLGEWVRQADGKVVRVFP